MSATATKRRTPILLWPVIGLWRMTTFVSNRIGILMTLIVGVLLMLAGYVLISTIIGAIIGIPLFVMGLFFTVRGLY